MIILVIYIIVMLVSVAVFTFLSIYAWIKQRYNNGNKSRELLKLEKLYKNVSNRNCSNKMVTELTNFCFEICKSMILKNQINDRIHLSSETDQFFYVFNLDESPFDTSSGEILSTRRNIWLIKQANEKMDFCHLDYITNRDNTEIYVTLKLTMKGINND